MVQLQAICTRILSLPACGSLKAALTGVELLLSRSQTWEEGAASHVSLSSQLQSCAALAMRWRAAEVNAWPHALAAVTQAAADAANATWFPLYRLMFNGAPPEQPAEAAIWLRSIATALEEFLRGASLGEFERRVALLWVFHGHVSLDAAASPAWTPLAALLCTLHRYYRQFVADVNRVLDAARIPIEAKLKDHVKLAKWEVRLSTPFIRWPVATHLRTAAAFMPPARPKGLHTFARQFGWVPRHCACAPNPVATSALVLACKVCSPPCCRSQDRGYHALRTSSERNQRVLHRLLHSWEAVLARPVAAIFVAAADAVGSAKELESSASALAIPAAVGTAVEGAAAVPAAVDDATTLLAVDVAVWNTHAQAIAASAAAAPPLLFEPASELYVARAAPLTARLGAVLGGALSCGEPERLAGPIYIEDICTAVVSRSAALRADRNATRPMKKKALTDLLRALLDVGVSPRRSAVPAGDRDPASWFVLPRVDAEPAFASPAGPWDTACASTSWLKAETYYFRNIARVQVRA